MTGYHNKAVGAYQKKNDENLSPLQVVVELYKGMLKNTREAQKNYMSGHLDLMTNNIIKVFNIIEVLQANLDHENGGEDAKFLDHFYNVVFSALSKATTKPDPAREMEMIGEYIQTVHDSWYALAYPKVPVNEAQATEAALS